MSEANDDVAIVGHEETPETIRIDTGNSAPDVFTAHAAKHVEDDLKGQSPWVYHGRCVRVVDGDTYDILVDCGFQIYHKIRVRLRGVDTPEKYGKDACEEGKAVSELVHGILMDEEVMIRTYKKSATSYNRWEADVFFKDENGMIINLAKFLVLNGHAEHVEGYIL